MKLHVLVEHVEKTIDGDLNRSEEEDLDRRDFLGNLFDKVVAGGKAKHGGDTPSIARDVREASFELSKGFE